MLERVGAMSVPEPDFPHRAPADEPTRQSPARPFAAIDNPAASSGERLAAWLALVCRMIPDVEAALAGFNNAADAQFSLQVTWPAGSAPDPALAAAAQRALQRGDGALSEIGGNGREVLARRLTLGPARGGAIAIAVPPLADNARHAVLQLLEWSALWLDFVSGARPAQDTAATVQKLLFAGLDAADLQRAATHAAGIIAQALSAERVSIGICRDLRVELAALSHSAAFNPRLQLNRDIVAAMEETLDEACPLRYPVAAAAPPRAVHALERLCTGDTPTSALAVPLFAGGSPVGALIAERNAGQPWSDDEQLALVTCADALARIIVTRQAIERTFVQRSTQALKSAGGWLRSPGDVVKKALLALCVVAICCVSFASGQLQVAAPAVLEGRIHRSLTAPIEGYVAEAPVRAGDAVKAGDVIAVVDTRSLEFERRRWASERAEYEKGHRRAIAELDRAEATILQARLGRAKAQLALIDEQLKRTTVTAPFDGMIVSGDLSRSMGAPVARGDVLFEIAPLDDYRVELEVDEADITAVVVGQTGHLALTALPGERLAFTVEQITSVAETSDGRNVFKVDGRLDESAPLLRPGMRGVGKIVAGEHRLIWVWTHRVIDRAKLWLWSRAP